MPEDPAPDDPTLKRLIEKSKVIKEHSKKLDAEVDELEKMIKKVAGKSADGEPPKPTQDEGA